MVSETRVAVRGDIDKIVISFLSKCQLSENINNYNKGKDKIENIGYSLYDVEYAKEGPNYYLRIYIDSPKGIDLNDCEKVSNEIKEINNLKF